MAFSPKSTLQFEFERQLERSNPAKVALIRARPYNCTNCFGTNSNGRQSINALDPLCNGTGYIGGQKNADLTKEPYSQTFWIYGDVQTGHGLYGAGGDYLKLLSGLGRQDVGDATLFCKMQDVDRTSGTIIYPIVNAAMVRPDIISRIGDSATYNVLRELIVEIGTERICRCFSMEHGSFTTGGSSK